MCDSQKLTIISHCYLLCHSLKQYDLSQGTWKLVIAQYKNSSYTHSSYCFAECNYVDHNVFDGLLSSLGFHNSVLPRNSIQIFICSLAQFLLRPNSGQCQSSVLIMQIFSHYLLAQLSQHHLCFFPVRAGGCSLMSLLYPHWMIDIADWPWSVYCWV